jgi:hypothetical protein
MTEEDDSMDGKLPSDNDASIEPNASSTSGNDMMDDTDDELDMLCSEGRIDLSDDKEGSEG